MKSPCLSCTKCKDPNKCENKHCQTWRKWFIRAWDKACARLATKNT